MNKFDKNKNKNKKLKKAAKVNAAAAKLEKKFDDGKEGVGTVVEGPEMDPAYCKTLKKIIDLADQLPNSVILQPNSSKEQKSDEDGDSNGTSKDTDSDDEAPTLVKTDSPKSCQGQMGPTSSSDIQRFSRAEKKARRLLMKLNLKPVENVYRVTMKKSKDILLVIENPDVYMCPTGTVIFFGKVLVEDLNNKAATQAAERYKEMEAFKEKGEGSAAATDGRAAVDDDDGDDVDEAAANNLDEKDIELVQMQAACSRKKAIKALLQNGHDVVNAIMDLTMG